MRTIWPYGAVNADSQTVLCIECRQSDSTLQWIRTVWQYSAVNVNSQTVLCSECGPSDSTLQWMRTVWQADYSESATPDTWALVKIYGAVQTALSVQYSVHFTLQCTLYSTVYTLQYSVHFTVQCTLYNTVYTLQYSVHFTLQCTLYSTVYTLQYSVHFTLQCTLYSTVYSVHYTERYSTIRCKWLSTVQWIPCSEVQYRGRSGNHSRIDTLTLVTFPVSCGDRVPDNSPGGGGSGQGGGGNQGIWWCRLVAEALHGDNRTD